MLFTILTELPRIPHVNQLEIQPVKQGLGDKSKMETEWRWRSSDTNDVRITQKAETFFFATASEQEAKT